MTDMIQQQQQRDGTKKRSREQSENGCPERKETEELGQEEEAKAAKAAKVDSEDGTHIELTTQVIMATHSQTKTHEGQPCCIQSVFRRDRGVRCGEPGGNLLKAGSSGESGGESEEESEGESGEGSRRKINVDFTGTDPYDSATEFHLEKSNCKQADALRYRSGDDNYYLAVKYNEVNLRKLVNFPTTDKYFFRIRSVGSETFHTFKSLKTGEYLHCSDEGKVFMKEAKTIGDAEPEDRQTWFSYKDYKQSYSFIECKTVIDTEDSGKGISKEPEKGTSQDSGIGENSESPSIGNSEDAGKSTPE